MKKAQLTLTIALNLTAFAQGTIQLSNSNLPGAQPGTTYEAYITGYPGHSPNEYLGSYGPGVFTAGLFLEGTTTPLVTTTFFSGTGEDAQYNYIFASEPQVAVPGIAPGSTGRFFVGAWRASDGTFANAVASGFAWGMSAVFTSRPLGGPNPTPGELPFTTPVTTFQSFGLIIPEPSTIAMTALGFGAFLLRRRKQSLP